MKFKDRSTPWKLIFALQFMGSVCVLFGSYTNFVLESIGQMALLPGSIISSVLLGNMIEKWELRAEMHGSGFAAGMTDRLLLPAAVLFNLALLFLIYRIVSRAKRLQYKNSK
jgi:hypothetical protein